MSGLRGERGSLLILALWMMVFFGSLAAVLAVRVDSQIAVVRRLTGAAHARADAYSGVSYVVSLIRRSNKPDAEPFTTAVWRDNPERFRGIAAYDGGRTSFSIFHPGPAGEPVYGLADEESRININVIHAGLFQRLFAATGRLSDDESARLAQQAVNTRNQSPAKAYLSVDELRLVPGMTAALFEQVRPHLTVYGSGSLNLNTVPEATFTALGLSPSLASRIVRYRESWFARRTPGKTSEEPFRNLGELTQRIGVSPEEEGQLQNIGFWTGESNTFRFFCALDDAAGRSTRAYECVADRGGRILLLANA